MFDCVVTATIVFLAIILLISYMNTDKQRAYPTEASWCNSLCNRADQACDADCRIVKHFN